MSQVRGLPLETEAASSPELGLQEGQVGGLQACAPVLPLNRSMSTYLTRQWCRTGRAVQGAPRTPTPRQPGAPSDTGCAHTPSTPHQHLPHSRGCGMGNCTPPPAPGQAHGWTQALRTQAHQKPRATRAEEQPHSRSSPHVRRDLGEPGKASSWASAYCANSPGSSHRTLSAESPETAQPGHLQPT